jgi:hypothetical protein
LSSAEDIEGRKRWIKLKQKGHPDSTWCAVSNGDGWDRGGDGSGDGSVVVVGGGGGRVSGGVVVGVGAVVGLVAVVVVVWVCEF